MKITKKQLFISAFSILVVLLVVWGFLPSPVPVTVDQARVAPLEVTIEEEGKTQVADRYTISAPVTGYVLRIQHEVGDTVAANQELFQIQPVPDLISARQREIAQSQFEAAKYRRQQAMEHLNLSGEEKRLADLELQRIQNLFDEGIGSEQGLDNAKLAARRAAAQKASAEFSLNIAEHEIQAAKSALRSFQASGGGEQISIRAPVGGHLLKIHQKSEGTVQAGTPILEIGDPLSLEIKADLLSADAVQVRRGTAVRIKRWGSDTILDGVVRVVEPSGYTRISALGVEEQRVPVVVDILSSRQQWQALGDGYRVVAEFIIWQGDNVLQVPSSSLFRMDEEWGLFLVDGGSARLRRVEAGRQNGLHTQIVNGLAKGETVLTHPDERIEDGVRVEIRN
ncbi:efflux RND transporter periplasmic adaptor subunit [Fodinibius salsisoli]|uniref:HlyD family efflux transporter periplasmic adaptor subunit n=1 Tax=Fodinibius salsisoli TaxID=2820877 RepID=A0ABT3PIG9_9BACT|nr:HlyD family efflux transporter periplasmic adaptor subunit [Fodinibius salsisoli]MCW9705716.1 HlyD family efflux transporter periplasmic adaptor subunit [Fodinibius salsisoli]